MPTIPKYHGTSKKTADHLQQGNIDPVAGGGELGQGFYLGDQLWAAKAWAYNRHKGNSGVLKVEVPESGFYALSIEPLTRLEAISLRRKIKALGATRTYLHGFDVLWSPIVGTTKVEAEQYKYESQMSINLLNGASCIRSVV
jgi:hypothetical protein